MKRIITAAMVTALSLLIGALIGVMRIGFESRGAPLGATPGQVVLVLMVITWLMLTLMIGQALPPRRRPGMISAMSRTRVMVTDQLRQAITAAYIGDGQPSIRDVAAKLQCSYGTVHRVLSEAGIVRPRGLTRAAAAKQRTATGVAA